VQIGKYLQHVYGETEYGGTQVLKLASVNFEKLGMPNLPAQSSASKSETIQHTLYQGMALPIAMLVGMTYFAKRNVASGEEKAQGEQS
jgi:hypothetical protein